MIFDAETRRNRESFSDGGAGLGVVRVEDGATKNRCKMAISLETGPPPNTRLEHILGTRFEDNL